jgi:hypothetical protein
VYRIVHIIPVHDFRGGLISIRYEQIASAFTRMWAAVLRDREIQAMGASYGEYGYEVLDQDWRVVPTERHPRRPMSYTAEESYRFNPDLVPF